MSSNKICYSFVIIFFINTLYCQIDTFTQNKEICHKNYIEYFKATSAGSLASLPISFIIGRSVIYLKDDEISDKSIFNVLSFSSSIASSFAVSQTCENNMKVFIKSTIITSVPILLFNKYEKHYLIFYYCTIPFISAYVGYNDDCSFYENRVKQSSVQLYPYFQQNRKTVLGGIYINF